jgi:ATP-dependent DNA helicase RecG
MINENFINAQILKWEDDTLEFKSSFDKDKVGKSICAFSNDYANVGCGYLIIGVDNKRKIIGVKMSDWDKFQLQISNVCKVIEPRVAPNVFKLNIKKKIIIVIEILRSSLRPHRYKNICYIRHLSSTGAGNFGQENELRNMTLINHLMFDSRPAIGSSLKDISLDKIRTHYLTTRGAVDVSNASEKELTRLLVNGFNLATIYDKKNIPTNAAILVFSSDPTKIFPNAYIKALRIEGTEYGGNVFNTQDIKGPIDEILTSAIKFLNRFMVTESQIEEDSPLRADIKEYPKLAIREALANAIIHRDYEQKEGQPTNLFMYDDRIEIINFGGLGGGLRIEDLGTGKRYIRNPKIAMLMYEKRWVEQAGLGISRMKNSMIENQSPTPIFESDKNFMKVVLPSNTQYQAYRLIEKARKYSISGNYDEARKKYKKSVEICPQSYESWLEYGTFSLENENYNKARECFKKTIELLPDKALPFMKMAQLIKREKKGEIFLSEAKKYYKKASEIEPANAMIFHKWGIFERDNKNLGEARKLLKKATSLDEGNYASWQAWGQIEIGMRNFSKGISCLERAKQLTTRPENLEWIFCDLAWAYIGLKRPFAQIKVFYEKALEANPNSEPARRKYASFLERNGHKQEAEKMRRTIGYRNSHQIVKRKHISQVKIGKKVQGKIKAVKNYGAFVDIGYERDAFVHISELSEGRVDNIHEILQIGDVLVFSIQKIDKNNKRISLSRKKH